MRWYLVFTFLFCLQWGQILAAPADLAHRDTNALEILGRREDTETTQTATDTAASKTPTATATNTDVKASTTTKQTSTATQTADPTTSAPLVQTSVPSVDGAGSFGGSSSNSTKSVYEGGLPIQPTITPAMGIAGIILILSGAALTFIGIRKPRIYIFLSTALLAALGVTVLIEYVQSPPVSNGVQGGYFVAIFFTGAVFGGLALVFKEITEGLCCLLGGFCIGMWLMTVKAGGLVTDHGAKVGFIIAFAVGFYCLSFSHYTRAYGSILCTSFAGATALILGIDCFSRAGLKEFWLYVWGLNDNLFPMNTNTYPITRNIRVESAIIIIITVFGVIAQLRLWKVIKERRSREEDVKREAQKQKEEAEAEVSRRVEEKNLRERADWENLYGNSADMKAPSMSETAVADDSRRGSGSGFASGPENGSAVELRELTSAEHSNGASDCGNTLEAVEEDAHECVSHGGEGKPRASGSQADHLEQEIQSENVQGKEKQPLSTKRRSEHGAIVGSEAGIQRPEHLSGRAFTKRKSYHSLDEKSSFYSEADELLIPPNPDDTSSVAGMVDDLPSIVSRTPSMELEDPHDLPEHEDVGSNARNDRDKVVEAETDLLDSKPNQHADAEISVAETGILDKDVENSADIIPTDEKVGDEISKRARLPDPVRVDEARTASQSQEQPEAPRISPVEESKVVSEEKAGPANTVADEAAVSGKSETAAQEEINIKTQDESSKANKAPEESVDPPRVKEKAKLDVSTVQNIPTQTSKIVNSFRTQEWAKHLADADAPDIEPLQYERDNEETSPEPEELATPVDIHGLLQTPLDAAPAPFVSSSNYESHGDDAVKSEQPRRTSRMSMRSPELIQPKRHSSHNGLTATPHPISRNVSSGSLPSPDRKDMTAVRNSISTPYLPVTTTQEKEQPDTHRWSGPAPLLAVRENMVRNRMSSTSLRAPDGAEDDMPLSQRRALLQRQTMRSPSSTSVHSTHSGERARPPQQTYTNQAGGRPAADMAAWRQSVRENLKNRDSIAAFTGSPISPSAERPRSQLWGSVQQMRDASNTQLGNQIAEGMQRGDMTDLHRKAMRRMQASANRKI
ncbi:hypothetical protein N7468_003580 [Penicillium chermesinum]|uniref:TM7S3/TM198-like domain-containing protein n=1 Tax=Penicillium chermesinum TaxID=63820 RepID=A0A9W9P7F5_9EURO|nr:uncharacterized protein N7468_003580 [Penicillium chermesinum]KAJ5238961.1 hypothetical protein N7468_003580 [Penicillium chermesinum]